MSEHAQTHDAVPPDVLDALAELALALCEDSEPSPQDDKKPERP